MEAGRQISRTENKPYQQGLFLSSLLLNSLYEYDVEKASQYLKELEQINSDNAYSFEILLGKAVISAFKNQTLISEELFSRLRKMENTSEYILPSWKIIISKRNKDWVKALKLNQELLELTEKENFRDGLPEIYLTFALAYFQLDEKQKSQENLEKSLSLIEEIRQIENKNLSLGLYETYHNAYRLLAQIKSDKPQESFELMDFLKARFLKDKISNSALKTETNFSPAIRQKLEALSSRFIGDQNIASEIEKTEKLITSQIPELNLTKPNLSELDKISDLSNTAVVSYFFTLDKKLLAYVWEKDKPVRTVYLPVTEDEIEVLAKTTDKKIKNFIFFKRNGKEIYDKLLKPLNVAAKHLVIIPDKSIWKIPFQALSTDGEKYLIEDKLISYAPSISILLEQLKNPKPLRVALQALANPSYDNKVLQHVNAEAVSVAEIYNAKPLLNATVADFEKISDKADILHFSMHAQVDNEQPLESFLAFKKFGKDDGRLTVEELLKIKLKKESLVFLASCDTNNVLSGEGLVSLAWGMMGSGATTVISAQWEANDKSTEIFTKAFYKYYKQGNSSAEAIQKASLELIKNKSNNMHEPYYWADFTLNGDYR
jgi:CHAT domain-containing protein